MGVLDHTGIARGSSGLGGSRSAGCGERRNAGQGASRNAAWRDTDARRSLTERPQSMRKLLVPRLVGAVVRLYDCRIFRLALRAVRGLFLSAVGVGIVVFHSRTTMIPILTTPITLPRRHHDAGPHKTSAAQRLSSTTRGDGCVVPTGHCLPLEMNGLSQPDIAYQPRVQPWEWDGGKGCVLKERRIGRARVGGATRCGVPSERGNRRAPVPRALPHKR